MKIRTPLRSISKTNCKNLNSSSNISKRRLIKSKFENSSLTKDNIKNTRQSVLINWSASTRKCLATRWWKGMENRIDTDIPITFPQGNDGAHSIASVDIMPGRKYFRPYFTPDADRCAVTIHGDRHERPAIVPALRTPLITPTISYPRYTILRNVPPRDLYLHTYLPVQTWRFILRLSNRATPDMTVLTSTCPQVKWKRFLRRKVKVRSLLPRTLTLCFVVHTLLFRCNSVWTSSNDEKWDGLKSDVLI